MAGAVIGTALAACTPSTSDFADRADKSCLKAQKAIARLGQNSSTSAETPDGALRHAIDRYVIVERLVSEIVERGLPDGKDGEALRDGWISPAQESLVKRQADLDALSDAVAHGHTAQVPALAAAANLAGTDRVDTALLTQLEMPACAAVFSA